MKLISVVTSLLLPTSAISTTVLGIDFGSLLMKVALVKRNSPIEIVTNLHSKRKTEQVVLFDAGTRFYGADANSLIARKPLAAPTSMSLFLGRSEDHPAVQVLTDRYYPIKPSFNETRSGVCLSIGGNTFTPEELVAMVLSHAKDITVAYGAAETQIKDCVLTVPSFYTQHERRSLIDAATLANLNILALIDETTAAGLHFGIDRIDVDPYNVLFYNMGASALQVSVIQYYSYERKESKYAKPKRVGAFQVIGKAWDATLGGQAFDARIVEHMVNEFNSVWNKKRNDGQVKDVRKYPRPMAKLRIQASKAKHVLSANNDMPIFIDALYDDTNYQSNITRTTLEKLCHDLFVRSTNPIYGALKSANMTFDDIHSVELVGGGMRIPKVQEEIKTVLGEKLNLGLHMNSDESMALGAAFHGANISTAFRVRHVGMTDINPFAVSIFLEDLAFEESSKTGLFGLGRKKEVVTNNIGYNDGTWYKDATIFKTNGKLGVKKTIAFSHDRDVSCTIAYEESTILPIGTEPSIERYNITGIADFGKEVMGKGLSKPKVSLQFEMSISGLTRLIKAEATVEELTIVTKQIEVDEDERKNKGNETEQEEIGNATLHRVDINVEKDIEEENGVSKEEIDVSTDKNKTTGNYTTETTDNKKMKQNIQKEETKIHKRILTVKSYHTGRVKPYTPEVMAESRAKLDELAFNDKERIMLEESRNKYEGYIYYVKNTFADEKKAIAEVSTVEQRESVLKSADDAEEWMYQYGYDGDLTTFEAKYGELSESAEKVFFRMYEATARPKAIAAMKEKLLKVEDLMKKWKKGRPHITEEEYSMVFLKVDDIRQWMSEKEDAQTAADPTLDPIFTSEEVQLQAKPVEMIVGTLHKKPMPKKNQETNITNFNETNPVDTEGHVGNKTNKDGGGNYFTESTKLNKNSSIAEEINTENEL